MKLYVLNLGYLMCDKDSFVLKEENQNEKVRENIYTPVMGFLIDHPNGKILYDTGSNINGMKGYWSSYLTTQFPSFPNDLQEQLALCNTKPEEIKKVVLSHYHMDHAGNLNLFPNAEIYLSRKDYEYGKDLISNNEKPDKHGAYAKKDYEVELDKHFIDEDYDLEDGVKIIYLPGHAPGLLGLVIDLEKEGTIILPQDCLYTVGNYGPPAKKSAIVHNEKEYFDSIEKVREIQKKTNGKVIFAHDKKLFDTLKLAPEYYE